MGLELAFGSEHLSVKLSVDCIQVSFQTQLA